jgi:hypothetical protein
LLHFSLKVRAGWGWGTSVIRFLDAVRFPIIKHHPPVGVPAVPVHDVLYICRRLRLPPEFSKPQAENKALIQIKIVFL